VATKELRSYNNLKTDRITVSQKLKIPPAKAAAAAPEVRTDAAPAAPAQPAGNPVTVPEGATTPTNPAGGAVRL
jgi:LysM repeat protein